MIARIIDIPRNFSFFLFGPRQTGKSTLIENFFVPKGGFWKIDLLKKDVLINHLKDPSAFRTEALNKIVRDNVKVIFIDEIQKAPFLLDEIQSLLFNYKDIVFIVTGSSARKLKRGAANLLAGRLFQRYLHPFTYTEIKNEFQLDDVLRFGTLPPVFNKNDEIKKEILTTYVTTYLKEEIQDEGLVRNLGGFAGFLDIAASQNGELVNYSAIARECKFPVRSVQSYFQILEDTLVTFRLDGWHKSVRKRLTSHPKYYLFDTGVTNAVCRRLDANPDPAIRGRLFEQWIVLETFRTISYKKSELRIFYWRTNAGAEVDMVFEHAGKLVAGCEIKSGKNITTAHTTGLRSLSDDHPEIPLFIVCDATEPFFIGKVEVLPWKRYFERLEEIIK
ncbi:MAG: ATP-binding protein [Bacteroidetes bacterium]|nr:ATP-binding protein [Bacteroidota bacterium]